MALFSKLIITHGLTETQTDLERVLYSADRAGSGIKLVDGMKAITSGMRQAKVVLGVNAAKASGTVTLSSHVATDTVTINGVAFTCVASGATGNQYNVGASDTDTATALAAAINASATALIDGYVTASSALGVVTITADDPGKQGNLITLAISAHGSVSGARCTGGDDGATTSTNYYGSAS
jgi:phage tail sheath gpL-like